MTKSGGLSEGTKYFSVLSLRSANFWLWLGCLCVLCGLFFRIRDPRERG